MVGGSFSARHGRPEVRFEEVDGVRLGTPHSVESKCLPLSQVFTDLLKNIPRTTVHKRMAGSSESEKAPPIWEGAKTQSNQQHRLPRRQMRSSPGKTWKRSTPPAKRRVLKTKRRVGRALAAKAPPPGHAAAAAAGPRPAFWRQAPTLAGPERSRAAPARQRAVPAPGRRRRRRRAQPPIYLRF